MSSSSSELSEECIPWIPKHCTQRRNAFLCEIDSEFIEDRFNLTRLRDMMSPIYAGKYNDLLAIILDAELESSDIEESDPHLQSSAAVLYGLIHARFILTGRGMHKMLAKYEKAQFGLCPKPLCDKQPVLPLGMSDILSHESVKFYCPKCNDVLHWSVFNQDTGYNQPATEIDGAYIGTTFPHMFLMNFPSIKPEIRTNTFTPTLFGFKIHPSALEHQLKVVAESSQIKSNSLRYPKFF